MKRNAIKHESREGKVKTTIWIDSETLNAIDCEANERQISKQSIIESTLKDRYSEAGQLDRDALIAERLNKLERALRRVTEQNEISAEAHALFVRMWLASTPEVPKEQRESAVQNAQLRYQRYLEQIAKRVGVPNVAS